MRFWVIVHEAGDRVDYRQVNGKLIGSPGWAKLFQHRNITDPRLWTVSEYKTGTFIVSSPSHASARKWAIKWLKVTGRTDFRKAVKRFVAQYGKANKGAEKSTTTA